MKYMLMIYQGDPRGAVSEATIAAYMKRIETYNDQMKKDGHFVMTGGLGFPDSATCVTKRSGKLAITDGPFTETREYLGGFYIIDARDLDQALKIADGLPMTEFATVEVRPINQLVT